jgi:hypothetical protein
MIESTGQKVGGTSGILITPNSGHFVSFKCGSFISFELSGKGIIADISAPACNTPSLTSTLKFEQTSGVQRYQQEETTGTISHLTSSLNGGAPGEISLVGSRTVTYKEKATITCP